MTFSKILYSITVLAVLLTGCTAGERKPRSAVLGQSVLAEPAALAAIPVETEPGSLPARKAVSTAAAVPISTATAAPSPTVTAAPTATATIPPTAVPTYVEKLRGKVIVDQAVCHYGPGAPYLYKYGVYRDSNLELLRRSEGGNYVEIQAIGGNNPCWVRVDYFEIKGDWLDLQPVRFDAVRIPISPYYASPGGASARRDGNEVTVFWNALNLRAGDDSLQTPYIVEAWVCQNGQNVFVPAGSWGGAVTIVDEPGCAEPSYGYFIAAEKHGYTGRVAVPWPEAE